MSETDTEDRKEEKDQETERDRQRENACVEEEIFFYRYVLRVAYLQDQGACVRTPSSQM